MFKKIKRFVAVGSFVLAMMFGIIVQGGTGTQPTDGSTVNAGIIIQDGTGEQPVVVAGIIINEANGIIVNDATGGGGDFNPQPDPPGATDSTADGVIIQDGVIVHD